MSARPKLTTWLAMLVLCAAAGFGVASAAWLLTIRGHAGAAVAAGDPFHPTGGMDPEAAATVDAYLAIQQALEHGSLDGVRRNARRIERFFTPMNPAIGEAARDLGRATELKEAQRRFEHLARLFNAGPLAPPSGDKTWEL